jgi:hypothetical protein
MNPEMNYQYSNAKRNLARLLATENINIVRENCKTAAFDLATRTMHVPMWEVDESVYDMLTLHEISHALHTPADGWHGAVKNLKAPLSYYNVVEDARIERLIKNKFGGAPRIMAAGYKSLHESDFFGVKDMDIAELILIDRINLYYKLGAHVYVPFSEEEAHWLAKIDAAETWEDCARIAEEIFGDQQMKNESEKDSESSESDSPFGKFGDSVGEDSKNADSDNEEVESRTSSQNNELQEMGNIDYSELDNSITDAAFRESMDAMERESQRVNQGTVYASIGEFSSDSYFVPVSEVRAIVTPMTDAAMVNKDPYLRYSSKPVADNTLAQYVEKIKNDNKAIVTTMVKEFEAKKSASSFARASVSKTGRLDSKKLHKYKTQDDIFRRISTTHAGKNHGMVMLLDWSGSVQPFVTDMVEQVVILAMANRRLGIPFSVQLFSDYSSMYKVFNRSKPDNFNVGGSNIKTPNMVLVEVLNSNSTHKEFNQDIFNLIAVSLYASHSGVFWWDGYQKMFENLQAFRLNGTPLTPALMLMADYLPKFSAANKCEITNLVVLTDGSSSHSVVETGYGHDALIFDKKSGMNLKFEYHSGWSVPGACNKAGALFKMIRARSNNDTRIHFYFIGEKRSLRGLQSMSSMTDSKSNKDGFVFLRGSELPKAFRPDSYTFVLSNKLNVQSDWETKQTDGVKDITKSFKKFMSAKKNTRKLVSDFIGAVA